MNATSKTVPYGRAGLATECPKLPEPGLDYSIIAACQSLSANLEQLEKEVARLQERITAICGDSRPKEDPRNITCEIIGASEMWRALDSLSCRVITLTQSINTTIQRIQL